MEENFPYLPEECWEMIFSFLLQRRHSHHFESLSLVCKQFLSITNTLRTTLRISELTIPAMSRIFSRFRQLKRIDLRNFKGVPDDLLIRIAGSGLDIESLDITNQARFPVSGMNFLGSTMRNLRVLLCSKLGVLTDDDLVEIAKLFPNLEDLDISYPMNPLAPSCYSDITDSGIFALIQGLPRLRKIGCKSEVVGTMKRPRKKKQTLGELKEEEALLLKERRSLNDALATLRVTVEKQREINGSLKKMKLELELQQGSTVPDKENSDQPQLQKLPRSICNTTPIGVAAFGCNGVDASYQLTLPNVSCKLQEMGTLGTVRLLPDLNLPFQDDSGAEALYRMS
ncbi:uncharacterized protein LOC111807180 isoform X2 [Cucurbita pepo subsp. pepo]|uniref:uncharacterized protein LOC111807180 isoform X2 n=1 Tax=Cucurbita pepo subsp. pepo TaxID=3664 RepID=UPI000C9D3DB2|nr:uncharacterized protein LOC111807180 isoform X2 [Cucurbita pepo subsp. pepo]